MIDITKKREEILKARKGLDKSIEIGKILNNYYGGWLDALDWMEGKTT